jgi:hypothetical protein
MSFADETRPEHCFDWITVDDAVLMAVRAFGAAKRHSYPEVGERFRDGAVPWSSRRDFAFYLAYLFELQVKGLAHELQVERGEFRADSQMLAKWDVIRSGSLGAKRRGAQRRSRPEGYPRDQAEPPAARSGAHEAGTDPQGGNALALIDAGRGIQPDADVSRALSEQGVRG